MKMTQKQLRRIIREEVQRLRELYPGSRLGSHLKQAVQHLWEADNALQRALGEVESEAAHRAIEAMHKTVEQLAFNIDGKIQKIAAA